MLEATALPIEPQPLPVWNKCLLAYEFQTKFHFEIGIHKFSEHLPLALKKFRSSIFKISWGVKSQIIFNKSWQYIVFVKK